MPQSDLKRVDKMADKDIDYSDIPHLNDKQLASMRPLREALPAMVQHKIRIAISLDADIVKWLKLQVKNAGAKSYQSLLNAALREYIDAQKAPRDKNRLRVRHKSFSTASDKSA